MALPEWQRQTLNHIAVRQDNITINGRYWIRTSDPVRVKDVRYHCANRPENLNLAQSRTNQQSGSVALRAFRFCCRPPGTKVPG